MKVSGTFIYKQTTWCRSLYTFSV